MQSAYDNLHSHLRSAEVSGQRSNRTTRGTYQLPGAGAVQKRNYEMHPFKLFRYPGARSDALTAGTEWRTWRVRGGALFIDVASGTFLGAADNTDGVDTPYLDVFSHTADGTLIDQSTVTEVIADENDITYVWIELDPGATPVAGTVLWHTDPTANGWDSWPDFDCKHISIGWIDTASRFDEKIAIPRQVLREDVCVF